MVERIETSRKAVKRLEVLRQVTRLQGEHAQALRIVISLPQNPHSLLRLARIPGTGHVLTTGDAGNVFLADWVFRPGDMVFLRLASIRAHLRKTGGKLP
jgi:hypothetical protein